MNWKNWNWIRMAAACRGDGALFVSNLVADNRDQCQHQKRGA